MDPSDARLDEGLEGCDRVEVPLDGFSGVCDRVVVLLVELGGGLRLGRCSIGRTWER